MPWPTRLVMWGLGPHDPRFALLKNGLGYEVPRTGKFIGTEDRLVVALGCGKGKEEKLLNAHKASFWRDENVLELSRGDGYTTP